MAPRAATAAGHQIQSKPIKVLDSQAPYEGGQRRSVQCQPQQTLARGAVPTRRAITACRYGKTRGHGAHANDAPAAPSRQRAFAYPTLLLAERAQAERERHPGDAVEDQLDPDEQADHPKPGHRPLRQYRYGAAPPRAAPMTRRRVGKGARMETCATHTCLTARAVPTCAS